MNTKQNLGWIGVGKMGTPMSTNLLKAGRKTDTPMPLTALVRQLYGAMKATGKGELDYFGMVALMEEMAGISD